MGLETTSKLCERNEQRVWENSPGDCLIAGEESPVIRTKLKGTAHKRGAFKL